GPSTVREVLEELNKTRPRAYTSVMTMMNLMADKGLLDRDQQERAYVYRARIPQGMTLGQLIQDLMGRAFEGSASSLVAALLDQHKPDDQELDEIRRAIDEYRTANQEESR
ncbi:MAG TPA: BlaI/MecI/CopY family transcriptional regulator, partial [Planctomycetaceae bacterium]|nr:BlaI/MecI/CopY family transcriptional regulator [Planctomycetaceae bacterium]